MAPHCPGQVVYFAIDGRQEVLARHLAAGGRGVLVEDGWIVLAEFSRREPLIALEATPSTCGGRVAFQVENVLAAAAAAWLLDLPREAIRQGLASFAGDDTQAPGRFNVFTVTCKPPSPERESGQSPDRLLATVVVDYAHNASALAAVAQAVENLPHGRRIITFSGCNRHDTDVLRQGEILGRSFDRIILYEDRDHSDRADGELNSLLRQGIRAGGSPEVVEYPSEPEALAAAMAELRPGDLLVLGAESIEKAIETVRAHNPEGTRCASQGAALGQKLLSPRPVSR
jgi:cyanophycin synthetase